MKKLFSIVFIGAMVSCLPGYGQKFIPKGTIIGGGSFSVDIGTTKFESSGSTSEDSRMAVSLTPSVAFFIVDDLAVGVGLEVGTEKLKDKGSSGGENSFTQLAFGPLVRYYFADGPFAQGSFGVGSRTSKFTSGGSSIESKSGLTTWRIGAGYSVRISDTILLDPMVGYGSEKIDNKDNENVETDSGLFIQVGFTLLLKTP